MKYKTFIIFFFERYNKYIIFHISYLILYLREKKYLLFFFKISNIKSLSGYHIKKKEKEKS